MIVPISDCAAPSSSFPWPTAIPAFISALVAVFVGYVVWQQWRTAREKLRLDLYNRRFDVYLSALAYAQALLHEIRRPQKPRSGKQTSDLFEALTKSYYESKFLFRPDSRIGELLAEMRQRTSSVLAYAAIVSDQRFTPDGNDDLKREAEETAAWLNTAIETLNDRAAPYLNFHKVN